MPTANYRRALELARKLAELNDRFSRGRSKEEREIARLNSSSISTIVTRLEEQNPWNRDYRFPKEG